MSKIEYTKLKLLRIYQNAEGSIVFGRAPVMPGPKAGTRDEWLWWNEVLHDRRAAYPNGDHIEADDPDARFRLDRLKWEEVALHCDCGRHQNLNRSDLIKKFGPSTNVRLLARNMFKCPARSRDGNYCRAWIGER